MNIAHPPPPQPPPAAPPPQTHPFAPAAVIIAGVTKLKDSLTSMNITHPPDHPAHPVVCHQPPPPPAQQYHCRNHQKCHIQAHHAHPAQDATHLTQKADVITFKRLYHPAQSQPFQPPEPAPPPAPPNQDILIVPQVIENFPLHLMIATHPFVGAPENVSVPPVIVIDE